MNEQSRYLENLQRKQTIWPTSGPFLRVFWMNVLALSEQKRIFLETKKSWPKALWELACESGSEFHKHSRMCERGEWRKQLRDFITQSFKQSPLRSGTISSIFCPNDESRWIHWSSGKCFPQSLRPQCAAVSAHAARGYATFRVWVHNGSYDDTEFGCVVFFLI